MLYFDKSQAPRKLPLPNRAFYGFFISHTDYLSLLNLCELKFNIKLLDDKTREIDIVKNPYMLYKLAQDVYDQKYDKITFNIIGKPVKMQIIKLLYSKEYELIVGIPKLKTNITCSEIPHVVIAKKNNFPNNLVVELLKGVFNTFTTIHTEDVELYINCTVGLVVNSTFEIHMFPDSVSFISANKSESIEITENNTSENKTDNNKSIKLTKTGKIRKPRTTKKKDITKTVDINAHIDIPMATSSITEHATMPSDIMSSTNIMPPAIAEPINNYISVDGNEEMTFTVPMNLISNKNKVKEQVILPEGYKIGPRGGAYLMVNGVKKYLSNK